MACLSAVVTAKAGNLPPIGKVHIGNRYGQTQPQLATKDGGKSPLATGGFFVAPEGNIMTGSDAAADLQGGILHVYPGSVSEAIVEKTRIAGTRSKFKLKLDLDELAELPAEVRAALIAQQIYKDFDAEFANPAFNIASITAHQIVTWFAWNQDADGSPRESKSSKPNEKWLVSYVGWHEVVPELAELGWLRFAFDAGVTPGDLKAWGVNPFTIIQLEWWQRREGESLIWQHVRAARNGWGTRYLSAAVRDVYRNLLKFVDQPGVPQRFIDVFAVELQEVRDLIAFFSDDAEPLSTERQAEWSRAFLDCGISRITPDAVGRFSFYLPAGFKDGNLRRPLEQVARGLELIGVEPKDWAEFDVARFGRAV